MNLEVISIECLTVFDPPVVRITLKDLNGNFIYAIDIPSAIYPSISGPLGWPTNPCEPNS